MRRVVVTGMGIVSSIGNNTQEVLSSLHEAKSGITRSAKYAELGFRSQVQGAKRGGGSRGPQPTTVTSASRAGNIGP